MLSDTEIGILKYRLKHAITTLSSEVEMIVIAENIWDQIEQKELCNHFMRWERVETALRAFTYFHIDIYDKQYYHDKKKMNIIKQLSEKVDYHDAMNQLFSDKTKFKIIKYDPSLTRLETI